MSVPMVDLLLVVCWVGLPAATVWATRSLTWTVTGLVIAGTLGGNLAQTLVALGLPVNTRTLQVITLIAMGVLLGLALRRRYRDALPQTSGLRRALVIVLGPAVIIGAFLVAMRLLAPGAHGPLTAMGYLVNHPLAEDNAKWLLITGQLGSGVDLVFSGYAGGPLLLIMAMVASLISVLSGLLLGGVNEVAVALNTLVGTQFLLICLVPFAFTPLVEGRFSLRGASRRLLPAPAVWTGMIVLVLGSAVITSYGHLSLQLVLLGLTLWSCVFLARGPASARVLVTLAIAGMASVWLPLNVLGAILIAACLVLMVRRRTWWLAGIGVAMLLVTWDTLVNSILFLLGIQAPSLGSLIPVAASSTPASGSEVPVAPAALTEAVPGIAEGVFSSPGGVEQVQPLVAGLALAAVLFAAWLICHARQGRLAGSGPWSSSDAGTTAPRMQALVRSLRPLLPLSPIIAFGGYVLLIQVADAVATGGAPHYGGHKLTFALVMMALASTLPIAICGLDGSAVGMTPVRWCSVGGILLILSADTILPRAVSALSPELWRAPSAGSPPYWWPAEVQDTGDQPVASLPIACLFAPPTTEVPSGLPEGQRSYTCTRLLIGLAALEGDPTGTLINWLRNDWGSNQSQWETSYGSLASSPPEVLSRKVILMTPEGGVAGLSTLQSLIDQYPPRP